MAVHVSEGNEMVVDVRDFDQLACFSLLTDFDLSGHMCATEIQIAYM